MTAKARPNHVSLPRRLFVTGTDTGVGKTEVTTLVLRGLAALQVRALPYKPAQSGLDTPTDAERLSAASDLPLTPAQIVTHRYDPPLAPGIAHDPRPFTNPPATPDDMAVPTRDLGPLRASLAHLEELEAQHQPDITLVEGAGGLLVPMPGGTWQPEWISALASHVLVVTRPDLGTLNHTLLTLEALRARNLSGVGLVVNGLRHESDTAAPEDASPNIEDPSVTTNLKVLARRPGYPMLGCVPLFSSEPAHIDVPSQDRLALELARAILQRLRELDAPT